MAIELNDPLELLSVALLGFALKLTYSHILGEKPRLLTLEVNAVIWTYEKAWEV